MADIENGHYVDRTEPGKINTSDVSAIISGYKAAKKEQRLPLDLDDAIVKLKTERTGVKAR